MGNASIVQSAYDGFGRGDIGAVIDLLADDVGHFHGKGGVGEFFQGVGGAWSALSLDIESVSEAGDLVVGVLQASGTRQDGSPGGYGATHVFTVRNDKIVRFREFTDLDMSIA